VTNNQRLQQQIDFLNGPQGAKYKDSFYGQDYNAAQFFHDASRRNSDRTEFRVLATRLTTAVNAGGNLLIGSEENKEKK